ncbi:MAG TPA: ThiF family adenylyltransferase [Bacillota bacterium]|nr:ThiF family adenylyltransferase [Bacillota bacterium]
MNQTRYSRQMLFSPVGEKGQEEISNSTVLIVGAGALGTVISSHLVRAGVGKIRLIDRDYVELSNLQRQMLFDEADVKKALPKAIAAKNKLEEINSNVIIEAIVSHVNHENISAFVQDVDVILDGTDNFTTRYLLNDISFKHNIPYAYGGIVSSRGMTAFFLPNETPCLRCMVKTGAGNGQTCDTVGVISPAVDMVASLQVTEALKYLTGNHVYLRRSLTTFDLWTNRRYDIQFSEPDPHCPTCSQQTYPALMPKAHHQETVLCGRNTVQIHQKNEIDLVKWEKQLANISTVKRTPFLLKAQFPEDMSLVLFPDGRVLVQGTEDIVQARTWYDKYIGS